MSTACGVPVGALARSASVMRVETAGVHLHDLPARSAIVKYHWLRSYSQITPSLGVCPVPPPGFTANVFNGALAQELSRGRQDDAHFFDLVDCAWLTRSGAQAHHVYALLATSMGRPITRLTGLGDEAFQRGSPARSQVLTFRQANLVVVLQYYEHHPASRPVVSELHVARRIRVRIR